MQKNRMLGTLIPVLLAVLVTGIGYYVTLPPLNSHSSQFWTFFFFTLAVIGGAGLLTMLSHLIPPVIPLLMGLFCSHLGNN